MSSLRDLMRRERESRKRDVKSVTHSDDVPKKVNKISQDANVNNSTNNKNTQTSASVSDPVVLEEEYEFIEDDVTPTESIEGEKVVKKNNDTDLGSIDNSSLVYEQLNTAFCSNLDHEFDSILKDSGIEKFDVEDYDSDDDDFNNQLMKKHTITSDNFGVASNIKLSTNENLPIGFFDDKNIDAKARGKLTLKELDQKINELSKKRSSYLREAKYVQDKYIESHRELIRLENDKLDNEETIKEFKDRIANIKNIITTSKIAGNVNKGAIANNGQGNERTNCIETSYKYDAIDDELWRYRSTL